MLLGYILAAEEIEPVKAAFERLRSGSGQHSNTHENYWVTRQGDRRLISWSNTALLDSSGLVEYVIGVGD